MITNLTVGRYGRFGNMLFQVAAVIGIARRSGNDYGFLPFVNHDHKERFGSDEDVELEKYFPNTLPRLNAPESHFTERPYSWGYHDIFLPKGNFNITGHFQSEKYFSQEIEEVRHYLTMFGDAPMRNECAIHIRRGDYDDHYHTRLQADYYRKALEYIPLGMDLTVFSDDPAAAELVMKDATRRLFRVVQPGVDYLRSFKWMKNCNHFICGNSSFSLMAAILSPLPGKIIVCPSKWFGPAWTPETKDIYPKNAIVI